jgi:hypothetical protein
MSAFVIGTMAPDFSYLIRLSPGGGTWHTPRGLLVFCLPAGLMVWWIFRKVISPALIRLLPPRMGVEAAKLAAPEPTWRLVPAAIVAILLGAVSHDIWDSFTHEARWGARQVPGLDARISFTPSHWMYVSSILQYASSLVGLLVVLALIWRWISGLPASARHVPAGDRAWRVREVSLLISSGAIGAGLNVFRPHPRGISWTLGLAAVGGMAALALAILVYGVIDLLRQRSLGGTVASGADD